MDIIPIKAINPSEEVEIPPVPHDQLFANPRDQVYDFNFDQKTAAVFDNMVDRSVPFYGEIQRMVGEIAGDFAVPGTSLYDLGCATGTTLMVLDQMVAPGVHFVGIDNSDEMLHKTREKLILSETQRSYELIEADLHERPFVTNASVVVVVLTLQFVRPLYRAQIIENIYEGLRENGCLILVEKVTSAHTMINRFFINYYYDFKKRNNYSNLEIAQKREALENVLIPYRWEENREMLQHAGFNHIEEFFRWYNFSAMLAVK
jgi:tRNA (cmo5U34)-methyltransferase